MFRIYIFRIVESTDIEVKIISKKTNQCLVHLYDRSITGYTAGQLPLGTRLLSLPLRTRLGTRLGTRLLGTMGSPTSHKGARISAREALSLVLGVQINNYSIELL